MIIPIINKHIIKNLLISISIIIKIVIIVVIIIIIRVLFIIFIIFIFGSSSFLVIPGNLISFST